MFAGRLPPRGRAALPCVRRSGPLRARASLDRKGAAAKGKGIRAAAADEVQLAGPLDEASALLELNAAEQARQALQAQLAEKRRERRQKRVREQAIYKLSAIAATSFLTALAIGATWYRFANQMGPDDFPLVEFGATLLLVVGGMFGMEMYARYAHRILWHEFQPGWALHKSHHEPRIGPFEANDIYAVMNAVPAIALCAYGFLTPGVTGGVCFGLGLGITLFGISYMFVHDGMVHRRFPVGPIADLPYLRRVAVAHQVHHSERYGGVPYGLFFGPQELEAVGGKDYLDELVEKQGTSQ